MAVPLQSIEPLRPVLSQPPLGLASDIDGTLAPIVPRPEDAAVSPRCRALLGELMQRGVRVALMTGRSLAMARRMVGLEGAAYAANHGLSLWVDGREETASEAAEYVALAQRAVSEMEGLDVPGVVLEDKGPVLAVHYRQAADAVAARQAVLRAIGASPAARAFRLHEGRRVVELRPPLAVDKGTALAALASRLGVRSLLCLGDDATDIDMFRAAGRLREGGLPVAIVAVRSEEATEAVLAGADYWVDGVKGVEWLLREVLTALPNAS
ncbi:MAG TPA: trehalose-phosphatase [Dehalococcoidia bacterium]|nr:trehalose-phosphatase [Dehalococcoidia bacterium]